MIAWGDKWEAPDGAPIRLLHSCGEFAEPTVVCDHCRETLALQDVRAKAGPGLRAVGTAGRPPL